MSAWFKFWSSHFLHIFIIHMWNMLKLTNKVPFCTLVLLYDTQNWKEWRSFLYSWQSRSKFSPYPTSPTVPSQSSPKSAQGEIVSKATNHCLNESLYSKFWVSVKLLLFGWQISEQRHSPVFKGKFSIPEDAVEVNTLWYVRYLYDLIR